MNGEQIGFGEIPVVVGFFLRAHAHGAAFGLMPESRFLSEAAAGFENPDVTLDFVFESLLQKAKRI